MKFLDRSLVVVSSLCLTTIACTGRPNALGGGTEGDSEGSSGTTAADPTNPNPTNPNPTSVGTGEDTTAGDPTTAGPTTNPTTGPSDTTGDESYGCCDVHSEPGCDEADVVKCVCASEASCCAFEWDAACVDLAMNECMALCEEPPMTTGEPGTTTGMPGGACTEIVTFEMQPSDATLSGDWQLSMSMLGEGEINAIINPGAGTDGTILFEPDIPCDDTWHIWVRGLDNGSNDSYFATLDGEPVPPEEAIFEADCTNGGGGYVWAELNWRAPGTGPCNYVEDPWVGNWTAGIHQIEFSYREINAMGRILLTNDPALVP